MGRTLGHVTNIGMFLLDCQQGQGAQGALSYSCSKALPHALQADLGVSGEVLYGSGKKA